MRITSTAPAHGAHGGALGQVNPRRANSKLSAPSPLGQSIEVTKISQNKTAFEEEAVSPLTPLPVETAPAAEIAPAYINPPMHRRSSAGSLRFTDLTSQVLAESTEVLAVKQSTESVYVSRDQLAGGTNEPASSSTASSAKELPQPGQPNPFSTSPSVRYDLESMAALLEEVQLGSGSSIKQLQDQVASYERLLEMATHHHDTTKRINQRQKRELDDVFIVQYEIQSHLETIREKSKIWHDKVSQAEKLPALDPSVFQMAAHMSASEQSVKVYTDLSATIRELVSQLTLLQDRKADLTPWLQRAAQISAQITPLLDTMQNLSAELIRSRAETGEASPRVLNLVAKSGYSLDHLLDVGPGSSWSIQAPRSATESITNLYGDYFNN